MQAVRFTISGKVQKVYFRKYTAAKAQELGLTGWVKNNPNGTVCGHAQGLESNIELLKYWLSNVGSPKCRIDESNFEDVDLEEYATFKIDRGK